MNINGLQLSPVNKADNSDLDSTDIKQSKVMSAYTCKQCTNKLSKCTSILTQIID